jgi:hypothetical protein
VNGPAHYARAETLLFQWWRYRRDDTYGDHLQAAQAHALLAVAAANAHHDAETDAEWAEVLGAAQQAVQL